MNNLLMENLVYQRVVAHTFFPFLPMNCFAFQFKIIEFWLEPIHINYTLNDHLWASFFHTSICKLLEAYSWNRIWHKFCSHEAKNRKNAKRGNFPILFKLFDLNCWILWNLYQSFFFFPFHSEIKVLEKSTEKKNSKFVFNSNFNLFHVFY